MRRSFKAADEVSRLQAPDNVVLVWPGRRREVRVRDPVGAPTDQRLPDGQLYVDLRGADGLLTTESALGMLLGGLGLHADDWPADPWRRVECYRSADSRSPDARRPRQRLRHRTGAPVARDRWALPDHRHHSNRMSGLVAREGARRLVLDVLSAESACTVLTAIIGEE